MYAIKERKRKEILSVFWSFRLSLELWAMGFSWYEKRKLDLKSLDDDNGSQHLSILRLEEPITTHFNPSQNC
jgi:hypothetical protein